MKPPVKEFKSPGNRRFTVGQGEHQGNETHWSDVWPILYRGKPAGQLFRNLNYGKTAKGQPRWQASTRELFWSLASDAPTGLGFDVAAFDTAKEALAAWSRSADQLLDWVAGKPVPSIYSKTGVYQRTSRPAFPFKKSRRDPIRTRTRRDSENLYIPKTVSLRKVPLNRGGYDSRGRYYGSGPALYELENLVEHADTVMVRAGTREEAFRKAVSQISYYQRNAWEKALGGTWEGGHFEQKIPAGRKKIAKYVPARGSFTVRLHQIARSFRNYYVGESGFPPKLAAEVTEKLRAVENELRPLSPNDISWKYVDKGWERARHELDAGRGGYAANALWNEVLQPMQGAAERVEKRIGR